MDKEDLQDYMIIAALFGSLYLYVQAFKIYKTKETAGVSKLAFVFTLISSIAWLIYGKMINDKVIIVSAVAGIIGSILILILILRYQGTEPKPHIKFKKNTRSPDDIIEAYNDHHNPDPWLFIMNDIAKAITVPKKHIVALGNKGSFF